ncbi:MAG: DNA polymerase III subunit gamma/tau [bacterium JZ-2024 1]
MRVTLYRKYRPQDFDEVVGQRVVVNSLKNALRSGQWSHAYLFAGPRGTGKTTTARILSKAFNCLSSDSPTPKPCKTCSSCTSIRDGTSYDVREMDAASHRGIDEIRNIREAVLFPPLHSRFKIYILDEAHMLTREAFNALLKTLEEPPPYIVFILCTTEPNKIPLTILSRCQRMDFSRISLEEFSTWLSDICRKEGIHLKDARTLQLLYDLSEGIPRDALSLVEQLNIYASGQIGEEEIREFLGIPQKSFSLDVLRSILLQKEGDLLLLSQKGYEQGWSFWVFLGQFQAVARDLLSIQVNLPLMQLYSAEEKQKLEELARETSVKKLYTLLDTIGTIRFLYKWEPDGRLLWDSALLSLLASVVEKFSSSSPEKEIQPVVTKESALSAEYQTSPPDARPAEGKKRLEDFQSKVYQKSPVLSAYLYFAEPIWMDEKNTLVLEFPQSLALVSAWDTRMKVKQELEHLLSEFMGKPYQIEWKARDFTKIAEEKLQQYVEEVLKIFPGSKVIEK